MFYLSTHSTHFYLRLVGVTHTVKNHSHSERENPCRQMDYSFQFNSKHLSFYMHRSTDWILHTVGFFKHQLWSTG